MRFLDDEMVRIGHSFALMVSDDTNKSLSYY